MVKNLFEVHVAGEIERGIPFPAGRQKSLFREHRKLLKLKIGDRHAISLNAGALRTDSVEKVMKWAQSKGIYTVRREIDATTVEIQRVAAPQSSQVGK